VIPVKATTNGAFGKRLEERIQKWASVRKAAARIRTPEELDWWYYQEWGTLPYSEKPDPLGLVEGTAAIWRHGPPDGKDALAFDHNGEHVVTVMVPHHPGIPARHMIRDHAKPVVHEHMAEKLHGIAARLPDHPELLQTFIQESAADAKDAIRDSFELLLSKHNRPNGRLEGKSAAEVFETKATIVPHD
jgi:hypothetical protein